MAGGGDTARSLLHSTLEAAMPTNWIWMQVAIVFFVVVGMIVAITKLA
jgi:hypothetical protein